MADLDEFTNQDQLEMIVSLYHAEFVAKNKSKFNDWYIELESLNSKDHIRTILKDVKAQDRINVAKNLKIDILVLDALAQWAGVTGGPQNQQGPTGPQTQQGVSGQQQDLASIQNRIKEINALARTVLLQSLVDDMLETK